MLEWRHEGAEGVQWGVVEPTWGVRWEGLEAEVKAGSGSETYEEVWTSGPLCWIQ